MVATTPLLPEYRRPATRTQVRSAVEQLFRWARFLDQGEGRCVSRQRALDALIDAADRDRELIDQTWLYALRSLAQGVGTRSVVALLDAARSDFDDGDL
jgi:hypothetical protein